MGVIYSYKKIFNNHKEISRVNFNEDKVQNLDITIPKKIHRIWLVFDNKNPTMPDHYKKFDDILKDLHPNYNFIEWDDESINNFVKTNYPQIWPIYSNYDVPVKKHDAARYMILHKFGGVFIQHSLLFQKNIGNLLKGADLVLSAHDMNTKYLWNGFIAAVPGHDFFRYLIDNLKLYSAKKCPTKATGPIFLSELFYKYFKDKSLENANILDSYYLLPFNHIVKNNEPYYSYCIKGHEKCFELFPKSYAFSQWSASWLKK